MRSNKLQAAGVILPILFIGWGGEAALRNQESKLQSIKQSIDNLSPVSVNLLEIAGRLYPELTRLEDEYTRLRRDLRTAENARRTKCQEGAASQSSGFGSLRDTFNKWKTETPPPKIYVQGKWHEPSKKNDGSWDWDEYRRLERLKQMYDSK